MAKVYVINKGGHDYSDAKRFGELHFLSEGPISKFAVSKIYREFAMQLRESTPNDYILVTGLTTMACIACSCFSFLHRGKLNMLLYKNGRYIERRLLLSDLLSKSSELLMKSQAEQIDELTKYK
jgi:hypothetical protein